MDKLSMVDPGHIFYFIDNIIMVIWFSKWIVAKFGGSRLLKLVINVLRE